MQIVTQIPCLFSCFVITDKLWLCHGHQNGAHITKVNCEENIMYRLNIEVSVSKTIIFMQYTLFFYYEKSVLPSWLTTFILKIYIQYYWLFFPQASFYGVVNPIYNSLIFFGKIKNMLGNTRVRINIKIKNRWWLKEPHKSYN